MPAEPIPIASQENTQQFPSLSSSHPIFGRWSAFSPKSPSQATNMGSMGAGSPPTGSFHDDDDIGDLRARTWAHAAAQRGQRRAASMSMSAGSSLLGSQLGSSSVGSPPSGGPLSDKVALGQGVLRRLSFSNGFGAGGRVSQACPVSRDSVVLCARTPPRQASLTSDVARDGPQHTAFRACTGTNKCISGTNPRSLRTSPLPFPRRPTRRPLAASSPTTASPPTRPLLPRMPTCSARVRLPAPAAASRRALRAGVA